MVKLLLSAASPCNNFFYKTDISNRGADKFLARPGRTQAIATEDFEFHVSYL